MLFLFFSFDANWGTESDAKAQVGRGKKRDGKVCSFNPLKSYKKSRNRWLYDYDQRVKVMERKVKGKQGRKIKE